MMTEANAVAPISAPKKKVGRSINVDATYRHVTERDTSRCRDVTPARM